MKLETNGGKVFNIRTICAGLRKKNTVLIELVDERPIPLIAADFDGLDSFKTYDEAIEGVCETYTGFKHLAGVQENEDAGTMRLTLAIPKKAK
jgi:hypothetical protein